MKSSQAELLITILKEGSVAAAARRLGRSRSTISTALAALEDDLGVQLFIRSGNELQATPIAQAIAPDCVRLLQTFQQIEARCEQERNGIESALRIARDDALPESFWRQTMAALKKRYPLTGLAVYLAPPQELPALIERQAVDLAFGLTTSSLQQDIFHQREMGGIELVYVAAPGHPLCHLPLVTEADLHSHTQITLAFLEDDLLVPQWTSSSSYLALPQFELIRDACIEGAGWACLPKPLILDALSRQQLVSLKFPAIQWQSYHLLRAVDSHQGPVVTWLENQLTDYLAAFD